MPWTPISARPLILCLYYALHNGVITQPLTHTFTVCASCIEHCSSY